MKSSQPSKIGRYEVVDRLGAGGMGVVYLATDPLLRRTVAIKVLPGQDDELRERFAREARSAASLRHHNVVTIFDIGEDDGQPFLAMEFLDGESMAELIRRRAPLSVERRLQLTIELCAGLGYAHRSGIVHRDIKPGNLMITTDGTLKVLDFGLARITTEGTSSGLTRAGAVMGTPHYMSPEQVQGEPVDPRSDIFSVGLVLYELLAYRRAYSGDVAHVVLHNIVHEAPPPIRDCLPDLDPELARIVHKAIEKHPDDRYQNLASLAAELERVRVRYAEPSDTATLINARPERSHKGSLQAADEPTPVRDARSRANLDAIARRRSAAVDACVVSAAEHLAAGRYDEAVAECEHAILLNPLDTRAVEIMTQAQAALDDSRVREWLDEARARLEAGALTEAQALIDQSLMLRADSVEALTLRQELRERRSTREGAAERARAARAALERATRSLEDGAFEAASRSASEVLAYDAENQGAMDVRRRANEAVAARRRQQEHDQWAADTVEQARLQAAHDPDAALALLEGFSPPHPLVTDALDRLSARIGADHPPAAGAVVRPSARPGRRRTASEAADGGVAPTQLAERPGPPRTPRGQTPASGAARDTPARVGRRGSAVMWAAPLAAVLVLAAGGAWFFTRAGGPGAATNTATGAARSDDAGGRVPASDDSTPGGDAVPAGAVNGSPGPAAGADAEVDPIHTAFTEAMARNNLEQAARVILAAPASVRQHATLVADMEGLLTVARRRASDAYAEAQTLPAARASAGFRAAQLRRAEATVQEREGQLAEAALGLIAAADLFARAIPGSQPAPAAVASARAGTTAPPVAAAVTAQAGPQAGPRAASQAAPQAAPQASPQAAAPSSPPVAPPATPPAVVPAPPPPEPASPNPAPAPPPAAPAARVTPADTTAADTAAIREALAQYVAGYERLDVGAIKRIYPNAPANLDLSNVRSYRLVLDNTQITLQDDRATVTATRRVKAQMKAGSPQESTLATEFSMRRAGSGWVIERVR